MNLIDASCKKRVISTHYRAMHDEFNVRCVKLILFYREIALQISRYKPNAGLLAY